MTLLYIGTLAAVVVLLMGVLPRIIFPLDEIPGTFLDRAVAGAVLITALTVAAMYVLAAIGLLEIFGLAAVWLATWWYFKGRKRERRGRITRLVHRFFTLSDTAGQRGASGAARDVADSTRERTRSRIASWTERARERYPGHGAMLVSVGVVVALAVAALLRFDRALTHLELVPQDSYLALFWTKSINGGAILQEGVYPQGTYMWMSFLDRFYPFDTHQFVRFAGPTMNVLELVALYWVTSRVTRSRAAGLLSITVFGLFAGHPALFVDWSRQIGAMTQEFATAIGLIALAFGALYMTERKDWYLALAGAATFLAVTSHTVTMIFLAVGFAILIVVGLVTRAWTAATLRRLIVIGLIAVAAGNFYFVIGILQGQPLAQSYDLYNPANTTGYEGSVAPATPGDQISGNLIFQLGFIGGVLGILAGTALVAAKRDRGRMLLAWGGMVVALMLLYDFVLVRFGVLFRVRSSWVTAVFMVAGLGIGLGALAHLGGAALKVRDLLWERYRESSLGARTAVELGALALALVLVASLWPSHRAFARVAGPSGYPQATEVSYDIIHSEERLTYTFVGVSEQFQEAFSNGWFVEAWVFAKDVTFSEARDPTYEIPIPTDKIYIFVEKQVFEGPESPPFGPTEEYYRDTEKRRRIMQRIFRWSEDYREYHSDMTIYYDDPELRVYEVDRNVDVQRAERSPDFKDYRYLPGQLFDDDEDITAESVEPEPEAAPDTSGSSSVGG